MAVEKGAASAHRDHGERGREFELAGEPLDFNANPNSAEYQPATVAEWIRNSREVIRVRLDRYNGRDTVDVRTWWRDAIGDLKPGRTGIILAIRHLPSLVTALNEALNMASDLGLVVTRPWAEFKAGKPLTKASLSRMLGKFGIISMTIRLPGDKTPKGYHLHAFEDAFNRYLPEENATSPQVNSRSDCGVSQNATSIETVALSNPPHANNRGHCGGVAVSNPFPGQNGARPMSDAAHGRVAPPDDRRPALGPEGDSLDDLS